MRGSVAVRFHRKFGVFLSVIGTLATALGACSSPPIVPAPTAAPVTLTETTAPAPADLYRDGGFLVGNGSIPFVGLVRFAGTEFLDSTSVLIALSIPPRALAFVRAGDRYASFYAIRIDIQSGQTITRSERPSGEVRVASFAETNRAEEGVIFQRSLRVAPGAYTLRITAYDSLGTGTGTATTSLVVPKMSEGVVTPIIPVFTAEPRRSRDAALTVVTNPKSTVIYGRDSVLQLYIEGYGSSAPDTIVVTASADGEAAPRFSQAFALPAGNSVRALQASIPVADLSLGRNRIVASRVTGSEIGSVMAIVSLGVDLPVKSTGQLVDALKYFATDAELQGLRNASATARPAQWAALLRRTDPNPATPENESLLEYAKRLRVATARYREGSVPGWQTDRGAVLAALGEPEAVIEPVAPDPTSGILTMTWDYRRHRLFLVFTATSANGVWKLTPASQTDFRTLLTFSGPCIGCR